MSRRVIQRSVGENGDNDWLDVRTVQELLLFVPILEGGPLTLVVDGVCGPKTMKAIHNFQLAHFGWNGADGRVDPGKQSFLKLKDYERQHGVFNFTICRLEYSPLPEPRNQKTPDKFYLIDGGANSTIYCWTPQGMPKPETIEIKRAQSRRQRVTFMTSEPRTTMHFQTQSCLHSESTGDLEGGSLTRGYFSIANDQNWEVVSVKWFHTWASPAACAFATPLERGVFHRVKS
jgi:hypothetical protein